MMTNEELVKAIQKGRKDLIPTLWEQVGDFIRYMANKRIGSAPEEKRDLFEDMIQEAYFHFLEAIEGYQHSSGAPFVSYLKYHLKTAFTVVLYGGRTPRSMKDPINTATSIDEPVSNTADDETFTLMDVLVDEEAQRPFRDLEEASYWNAMYRKLKREILSVKMDPTARKVLLYQLEHGVDATQARKALEVKGYYLEYNKAIKALRVRLKARSRTDEELAEVIPVRGYGVKRFKERGYTSLVEQLAVERADRELFYKRMRESV